MYDWIIIGTCGDCGGPVKTPHMWSSTLPPPKQCAHCGMEASDHGPVIPMKRKSGYRQETSDRTIAPKVISYTTSAFDCSGVDYSETARSSFNATYTISVP